MDEQKAHSSPVDSHYRAIIFRQYIYIIFISAALMVIALVSIQQYRVVADLTQQVDRLRVNDVVDVQCVNDDILLIGFDGSIYTLRGPCATKRVG